MGARFAEGQSIQTTNTTREFGGPKALKTKNTMNGMPGYIDAHQREDMGGAKGGKGFGPKREGPLGEKGGSGAKGMGKGKAAGTTVSNYKSASTDSAGTLKEGNATGSHKIHTANRTKSMPGQKAPPTTSGNITGQRVGIDNAAHRAKNNIAAGIGRGASQKAGHSGRMESLKGRAQTSWEGRRKSSMY